MAHYYVIRHYSENNERKTPANYPYEDRAQAERQYNLLCAAAWLNEINKDDPTKNMNVDFESVEMGTVEQGGINGKRMYIVHTKAPQPEPEPEPEEPENEPAE